MNGTLQSLQIHVSYDADNDVIFGTILSRKLTISDAQNEKYGTKASRDGEGGVTGVWE